MFKIKYKNDEEVDKFKVRLLAQGFLQQMGVDYNKISAPVVYSISISLLLVVANHENWELEQMSVVTIFLTWSLQGGDYWNICMNPTL